MTLSRQLDRQIRDVKTIGSTPVNLTSNMLTRETPNEIFSQGLEESITHLRNRKIIDLAVFDLAACHTIEPQTAKKQ